MIQPSKIIYQLLYAIYFFFFQCTRVPINFLIYGGLIALCFSLISLSREKESSSVKFFRNSLSEMPDLLSEYPAEDLYHN